MMRVKQFNTFQPTAFQSKTQLQASVISNRQQTKLPWTADSSYSKTHCGHLTFLSDLNIISQGTVFGRDYNEIELNQLKSALGFGSQNCFMVRHSTSMKREHVGSEYQCFIHGWTWGVDEISDKSLENRSMTHDLPLKIPRPVISPGLNVKLFKLHTSLLVSL